MRLCDLHAHSIYSDGTYTPEQLVEAAREAGLSALVLSDHNTVGGLPSFLAAAKGSGIEAIAGIELSTEYCGTELHILGLYLPEESYPAIDGLLAQFLERKEQSNRALVHKLNQAGIFVDYDEICRKAAGRINRAVIAAQMVEKGYCQSVKEAFSRYLSEKNGLYVPPLRTDAYEAIRFLKSIRAVAVLAHPFLNLSEEALRGFLPRAVEEGLDGMEVYYPLYDEATTQRALQMAEQFHLLPSGGSDFHGANKPDIFLGKGKGNLVIPLTFAEQLKQRSDALCTEVD